jgi:cell shape-determining protein MreC
MEYESVLLDNRILKNELSSLSGITYQDSKVAKVVVRDLYGFYDEVIINRGKDEIEKYDALVNEDGIVGVVYKVNKNTSYAKLLSSHYNLSVRINGVYGNYNNGVVSMIDKYSDIKVGDLIYTSGLDGVASDLYVGKVLRIYEDEDELGLKVDVKIVNNGNLNYVVIKRNVE